jgi:phosphotransferase system  glucose/maltose/N-acetylglucosamine-specific IIC component
MKRWNKFLKIFGYKIHLIIDGASLLPIMLCITPANVHESVPGVILLLAVWLFYSLIVLIVRADAAYFDRKTLGIIRNLFGAKAYVDYNVRRKGKKFLATLPFLWWWKEQLAKRGAIERSIAILKRWYGLKYFQVQGLVSVTRYAVLTCMAMLLTALAAQAIHRPELMRSPKRLLAL